MMTTSQMKNYPTWWGAHFALTFQFTLKSANTVHKSFVIPVFWSTSVKRLRRKTALCAAFVKVMTQILTDQFNLRFFVIQSIESKLDTGALNIVKSMSTLFRIWSGMPKMESAQVTFSNAVVILNQRMMKCANIWGKIVRWLGFNAATATWVKITQIYVWIFNKWITSIATRSPGSNLEVILVT